MVIAKLKAQQQLEALAQQIEKSLSPRPLVVGLSGGADSTLALLIAVKLRERSAQWQVQAVHCIHGLDAGDPIWLEHCRQLCLKLKVPLTTPRLHIVYGGGISPEDSSRRERYKALLQSCTPDSALMLGHQADDQVENLLLALKRGSGPCGLGGMQLLCRDERGLIVRPLLHLTKDEIKSILQALDFTWVEDESNSYLKFERNFFRLKVLPLLRTRFPGIDKAILRSAKLCTMEHELACRGARAVLDQSAEGSKIRISPDLYADKALCLMVLREFFCQFMSLPPELEQLEACRNLLALGSDQQGLVYLNQQKFEVRCYQGCLYLRYPHTPMPPAVFQIKVGQTLTYGDYSYRLKAAHHSEQTFMLTSDEVDLCFGMSGKLKLKPQTRRHLRELKKIFGEHKVPYWERCAQPLVKEGDSFKAIGNICACTDERSDPMPEHGYVLEIIDLKAVAEPKSLKRE